MSKTLPVTVAPVWGGWFLAWLDSKDPFEAFDIWKREMASDYEWFEDYCESDDYDICVVIDWYYDWYRNNPLYRLLFCFHYPDTILDFLQWLYKRYWQKSTNKQ